ncbi:MAG: hypothetical protein RBS39_11395 [Phycisphaerales bacterium]|jgi:membrane-bound ClpP family serine protease|nr:hypothetical protein [Phycisphaerales bacterium]
MLRALRGGAAEREAPGVKNIAGFRSTGGTMAWLHATTPAWFRRGTMLACFAAWVVLGFASRGLGQDGAGAAPAPGTVAVSVPAARQADNVAVITIHGPINSWTAWSFRRRLDAAIAGGANAVVVDLDTPGGELGAVLEISQAIKNAPLKNIVAWIHPTAYSGGAIVALACREIVVSPNASMGDALIIQVVMGGVMPIDKLPENERQKQLSVLMADVVDSARLNGYDEYFVQGFVALGVELWLVENAETGERICIDEREYRMLFDGDPPRGISDIPSAPQAGERPSLGSESENGARPSGSLGGPVDADMAFRPASPELRAIADQVDMGLGHASKRPTIDASQRGKWRVLSYASTGNGPLVLKGDQFERYRFSSATIASDAELQAFFGAKNVTRLDVSWSERLVNAMTVWWVRGILAAIFLLAMFLEMTTPGIGLAGAIAAVALVALLAPPLLVGLASWWEIAAIAAGILLLAVEIFVIPGFGVAGILGLLLLFGGLIGTFAGGSDIFPDAARTQRDLLYGVVSIGLAVATAGVGTYFIGKHLGSVPVLGALVLKDARAEDDPSRDDLLRAMRTEGRTSVAKGSTGVVTTPLKPLGDAMFGERRAEVQSVEGFLDVGTPIVVVGYGDLGVPLVERAGGNTTA